MRTILTLTLLFCFFATASADIVYLENGRELEGEVTRNEEEDTITVRTTHGAITIQASKVIKIVEKETPAEELARRHQKLEEGDFDGLVKLADFAREHHLFEQERELLQQVLVQDPNNERAHKALGHKFHDGRWMTEEQAMEAQGLVKWKGEWISPEERDLALAMEKEEELRKETHREVRKQLHKLAHDSEALVDKAKAKLGEILDEDKEEVYIDALDWSKKAVRLYATQELGRMKSIDAAKRLAKRVTHDTVAEVREAAVLALTKLPLTGAPPHLIKSVLSENRLVRIRATDALYHLPDRRAIPYLIHSLGKLVGKIEDQNAAPWGVNATNTQTGFSGPIAITPGGGTVLLPTTTKFERKFPVPGQEEESRAKEYEKEAVIRTLEKITGQQFGEDYGKWMAWIQSVYGK